MFSLIGPWLAPPIVPQSIWRRTFRLFDFEQLTNYLSAGWQLGTTSGKQLCFVLGSTRTKQNKAAMKWAAQTTSLPLFAKRSRWERDGDGADNIIIIVIIEEAICYESRIISENTRWLAIWNSNNKYFRQLVFSCSSLSDGGRRAIKDNCWWNEKIAKTIDRSFDAIQLQSQSGNQISSRLIYAICNLFKCFRKSQEKIKCCN